MSIDLSSRPQKLFGLGAGLLSSQILFLFALVSAPEPAPLHGAYFWACCSASVSIAALAFALGQIVAGDEDRAGWAAVAGVVSAGTTITFVLWHFIGGAAGLFVIVFGAFAQFEKRLPTGEKRPGLDLHRLRELKAKREAYQERLQRRR